MNQSAASARYYLFEDILWELPSFAALTKRMRIADLQTHAALVWAAEKGDGKCPAVKSRPKGDTSDYNYDSREIHLAPKHQCLGGLLHEIAHALGPRDKLTHGPAYRRRCIRLYRLFGGWNGEVNWET